MPGVTTLETSGGFVVLFIFVSARLQTQLTERRRGDSASSTTCARTGIAVQRRQPLEDEVRRHVSDERPPPRDDGTRISRGRNLFHRTCLHLHGWDEWWGEEKGEGARARARVCVCACTASCCVTTILLLSRTFGWRGEEKVCLCVRAPLLVTTILLLEEEEGIF